MSNAILVFRGETRAFDVAVVDEDGAPVDLTDAKVGAVVRPYAASDDLTIDKRNAAAGGSEDDATVLAPATDGVFRWFLVPADTENLDPNIMHWYAWVELADGTRAVVVPPDDFVVERADPEIP